MHVVALISFGLLGGALVGALAGFVMAAVVLTLRRLTKRWRVERGPRKKNPVLSRWSLAGAVLGGLVGAIAHVWLSALTVLALALAVPVAVMLIAHLLALVRIKAGKSAPDVPRAGM